MAIQVVPLCVLKARWGRENEVSNTNCCMEKAHTATTTKVTTVWQESSGGGGGEEIGLEVLTSDHE